MISIHSFFTKLELSWKVRLPSAHEWEPAVEAEIKAHLERSEMQQAISIALSRLGENCQQLIRLRYFENLSDREVIEKGLTPYSNVNSLKIKRCKSLKQLGATIMAENLYARKLNGAEGGI